MRSLVGSHPLFDAGMEGFIFNTARKEYWRVQRWYEFDDLVSDGYLAFSKCLKAYPQLAVQDPSKDQRKHFQSLVKAAFFNRITDLAKHRMMVDEQAASSLEDEEGNSVFERKLPAEGEMGTLTALIAQLPWELKELCGKLLNGADDFERKKLTRRSIRETTNEFYCRLLGVSPEERDLVGELRSYFE